MTEFAISKIDAARRQLECAIRLYFNSSDAIAIHTLAAAARNVLVDLCTHRGAKSELFRDDLVERYVKPEHHATVRARYRRAENFFKHADRDPDGLLSFNPESSDYIVFEATEAYAILTGESTPPMLSFRTWWLCTNEFMQKVLPPEAQDAFAKMPYLSGQRLLFFTEITPLWRAGWR